MPAFFPPQVFCGIIFAPVVYFMVGLSTANSGGRFFTFMAIGAEHERGYIAGDETSAQYVGLVHKVHLQEVKIAYVLCFENVSGEHLGYSSASYPRCI